MKPVFCYRCKQPLKLYDWVMLDCDDKQHPVCRNQFECQERMPLCYGEKPDKLKRAASKRTVGG